MALYISDENSNLIKIAGGGTGGGLPLGFLIPSTIVSDDSSLHLADGSVIAQDGIYADFCTWVKSRKAANDANVPTCTQAEFDSSVTTYGQCGKYVIDDEAGTIRLPKITKFVQGLASLSEIGNAIHAGLPNITGAAWSDLKVNAGSYATDQNSALKYKQASAGWFANKTGQSGEITNVGFSFDASNSNSIYGNSNTVQPESVQYPYYIVVATSIKTDAQVNIEKYLNDLDITNKRITVLENPSYLNFEITENNTYSNASKIITIRNLATDAYATSFSLTTHGRPVYINLNFSARATGYTGHIQVVIDDVAYHLGGFSWTDSRVVSSSRIINIPAGTHIIRFEAYLNSDTSSIYVDNYQSLISCIYEI